MFRKKNGERFLGPGARQRMTQRVEPGWQSPRPQPPYQSDVPRPGKSGLGQGLRDAGRGLCEFGRYLTAPPPPRSRGGSSPPPTTDYAQSSQPMYHVSSSPSRYGLGLGGGCLLSLILFGVGCVLSLIRDDGLGETAFFFALVSFVYWLSERSRY